MPDVKHVRAAEQAAIALVKATNAQREVEDNTDYGKGVVGGIRQNYTLQEELALHRKALMHLINKYGANNDEELSEFVAYNSFVEQVKEDVKEHNNHE